MNQTTRVDATHLVREHEVVSPGGAPLRGGTFEGRRLVVACDAYLLRLAPESGRIVDRFETFPAAASGGLAFDGRCFWQCTEDGVQQLEERTGYVVGFVALEMDDVTGLECLDGDLLILHSAGRRLTRIRGVDHGPSKDAVVVADAETPATMRGLTWAAGQLWSSTSGALVRIDPVTAGVTERLVLSGSVEVCDLAADSRGRFWCVDGVGSTVRVLAH
jgi:hypothetical protein